MAVAEIASGGLGSNTTSGAVDATGGNVLVALVLGWRSDGNGVGSNSTGLAATFNSVSMTRVFQNMTAAGYLTGALILGSPTQSSQTLAISFAQGDSLAPDRWEVMYVVLSGASSTADASNSGGGGPGTGFDASLTTVAEDTFMYVCAGPQQTAEIVNLAASTNTTAFYQGTRGAGGFSHSSNPLAAGGQTMSFTLDLNRTYAWGALSVKPSSFIPRGYII